MLLSESNKKRLQELAGISSKLNESTEKNIEEISINDINLPKDYVHDHLNEQVWDGDVLKQDIQEMLERIANDFYEYISVDVPVDDIWLTGSLANYNWTEFSDVDLHILIDYSKIPGDEEFIRDYLGSKKTIWNDSHDIKIKGFDVELYAQDTKEPHMSTGVYSIMNEEWVRKPSLEDPKVDREDIKAKVKLIADKIEEIEGLEDLEKTQIKGDKLKDKIKKMRQSGLDRAGEFSTENLAFKYLRNNGYIDRMWNAVRTSYDKSMSITEEEKTATFEFDENKNLVSSNEVLNIVKSLHRNQDDFDNGNLTEQILKFNNYELAKVPMSTLDTNDLQINPELVDEYVEMIKTNPDYPPVVYDPQNNLIIDGAHRVKALEKLGYDSVRAYVGEISEVSNVENINESIRNLIRKSINEFYSAKGFHGSMDAWLDKWRKKGVDVDSVSYGDGVDMGFSERGELLSEDEVTAKTEEELSPSDYDVREVEIGQEVEMEHTESREEALVIAMQHLDENGTYYSQLGSCHLIDEEKALEIWEKYFGEDAIDKTPKKINESEMINSGPKQHKVFFEKNLQDEHGDNLESIQEFIKFCCKEADIKEPTKVYLRGTRDEKLRTTASYNPNNHDVHIYSKGRHVVDVMRSIAHELMHMRQMLDDRLYDDSGDDGSNEENEAHSFSGLMIRKYGRETPKIYEGYKNKKNLL